MRFPKIGDIASTSVVSIDVNNSITKAIDMMLLHEHRNVIISDKDVFRILTVLDVLSIEEQGIDLQSPLRDLDLTIVPTIEKDRNILDTLEYLNNDSEYICIINKDKSLYGIMTHTDITSNIDPDTLMDNYTLQDFLKLGRRTKWVHKDDKTSKLLSEMAKNSFDNVIIVENAKPIGILTTKDIMRLIKYKKNLDLPVHTYMSQPIDTIKNTSSIKEALDFIKEKHYKRVVVVDDNGDLSGIISQKELISLTYSKWAILMKEYHEELNEINTILEHKNKEYEAMASTDSLTGLYNRKKFTELYKSSYKTMTQRNNNMSMIMLDIDFFKKVNDTHGHNSGDNVLIQVSHAILKALRDTDIVSRWGGEEFLVLLPATDLDNAAYLAEKIRSNIQELKIDRVGHITASLGVSQVNKGDKMDDIIDRVDKALYLAKNSGRNSVKTEKDLYI